MNTGLIHIFTGNGKGKTTASLGLGVRALGSGAKVLMVQFLKGSYTSEEKIIAQLTPAFILHKGKSIAKFTQAMNEEELRITALNENDKLAYAIAEAGNGKYDLLILDEIMAAINGGFIKVEQVISFLKDKPANLEVVMTGRNAPPELVEIADYVSEIREIKHPYNKGTVARKGIEF